MAEKCGDRFGTEGFDSRFVEEHQNSLVGVFLLSLKEVSIYHSLLEDMMSEASSVFAQHVLVKDKLEK